jgi:hypothetical protein
MTWEKFVSDWGSREIIISGLELKEPLHEKEVEAVLAVCYEPYHTRTIKEAAESIIYRRKRTVDGYWEKIYDKLPQSLENPANRGRYLTVSAILSKNFPDFSEKYGTIVSPNPSDVPPPLTENILESPEGVVPIGSRFYMEPASVLEECQEEITQPQALLRIQAPRQRGKTSLSERIMALLVWLWQFSIK